jgi:hypothetical protein
MSSRLATAPSPTGSARPAGRRMAAQPSSAAAAGSTIELVA